MQTREPTPTRKIIYLTHDFLLIGQYNKKEQQNTDLVV